MGAVTNMAPQLFSAVLMGVPFVVSRPCSHMQGNMQDCIVCTSVQTRKTGICVRIRVCWRSAGLHSSFCKGESFFESFLVGDSFTVNVHNADHPACLPSPGLPDDHAG
jgi:hypothetical protein